MKIRRFSLGAAAAFALLAVTGAAQANTSSAQTFCYILDQTGELKSKCHVSGGQNAIEIRMTATADSAAVACPQMVDVAHQLQLPFDSGWSLKILPPGSSNQTLAQCAF